jgi:hypothetical protein
MVDRKSSGCVSTQHRVTLSSRAPPLHWRKTASRATAHVHAPHTSKHSAVSAPAPPQRVIREPDTLCHPAHFPLKRTTDRCCCGVLTQTLFAARSITPPRSLQRSWLPCARRSPTLLVAHCATRAVVLLREMAPAHRPWRAALAAAALTVAVVMVTAQLAAAADLATDSDEHRAITDDRNDVDSLDDATSKWDILEADDQVCSSS